VHRDIKPQNVMLDREGHVKVMDFGIARAGDSGMTEAGSILGTAQYLAPEQAKGQPVDERSDLYSVGIVLYEMLTGTVPFKGDSAVTVALKHVNEMAPEPATIVPGLPYSLNQIILKAIAKDPDHRYQTAEQFARDLRSAQAGGPLAAAAYDAGDEATRLMGTTAGYTSVMATGGPLDQQPTADRRRRKRRWPVVLLVAVLLAVIAAAAYGVVRAMDGSSATVPSVVGQSRADAVSKLQKAGFKAGVQQEYSDKFGKGIVSRQAPAEGTKLRKGETVDIWVSKGPETLSLVDFKGWAAEEVQTWLADNDLTGVQKSGKSTSVGSGKVYKQDPKAGTEVKRGDTVTYWVSSGKPQATVPDLSNLTQADALTALSGAGLVLGSVATQTSSSVPAGEVVSQDPPAGTTVDKGSAVNIVVSSGSPSPSPSPSPSASSATVPDVFGMDSATASTKIAKLGLSVVIKKKGNTGQPVDSVVNTVPAAGSVIPVGSTVVLVVAK
jgi:beta-lactam-binding protein with PASTA domain